jgi:rhodanese-related sulfurtransferase
MAIADSVLYVLGRWTGWWLLGLLCRLSLNPESCILRAANSFYKRGRSLLLFAKFLPGINTLAAPLAGSMNMRYAQFFWLDLAGAAIYTGAYLTAGYLFSDAIGAVTKSYHTMGMVLSWAIGVAAAIYVGVQIAIWIRARSLRKAPLVKPAEVARRVAEHGGTIYDVRSHGYYDPKAVRIAGSKRLEPSAVERMKLEVTTDMAIYLYCTCYREATSSQVALELMKGGLQPWVIEGGLKAWRRAGLPVEKAPPEEMAHLPVFQS